jgi:hypothetical protein
VQRGCARRLLLVLVRFYCGCGSGCCERSKEQGWRTKIASCYFYHNLIDLQWNNVCHPSGLILAGRAGSKGGAGNATTGSP